MGKKKTTSTPSAVGTPPRIYEATLGSLGAVIKGAEITQAQAEARRVAGDDVVVCGPDLKANNKLAALIEGNANTTFKACFPHQKAGPYALPHFQPNPRPPHDQGHTFYETPKRKAR